MKQGKRNTEKSNKERKYDHVRCDLIKILGHLSVNLPENRCDHRSFKAHFLTILYFAKLIVSPEDYEQFVALAN